MAVDVSNLMKRLYSDPIAEKFIVQNCPALQWIDRDKKFVSQNLSYPVMQTNNQRVGSDYEFVKSGSNSGESQFGIVNLTQKPVYGVSTMRGVDLTNFQASGGTDNTFLNLAKDKAKQTLESMGGRLGQALHGTGTNTIGVVGSGTSSPITVSQLSSTAHVYVGQVLRFSPNSDASSPRSGDAKVTKVDKSTGVITYSGTVTSLAVGDYIFPATDISTASSLHQGLEYYNPASPTNTNANGLDQTVDTLQNAGMQFDCNASATRRGFPIETGIGRAIALHRTMTKFAVKLDALFMNPLDVDRLRQSKIGGLVATKIGANEAYKKYELSIEAFEYLGIKIIEDPFVAEGVARGIKKGAFCWFTAGNMPEMDSRDGLILRLASVGDNFDFQCVGYGNFGPRQPSGLLRIKLPTLTAV
jgi:hypothetical protein